MPTESRGNDFIRHSRPAMQQPMLPPQAESSEARLHMGFKVIEEAFSLRSQELLGEVSHWKSSALALQSQVAQVEGELR